MTVNLQLLRLENSGAIFADPTSDLTVRFRNTTSQKTLNGVTTKNNITEIICNNQVMVEVADGVFAKDAVSVRIRTSGSPLSENSIGLMISALATLVPTWASEHVFIGFNPTTPPVVP